LNHSGQRVTEDNSPAPIFSGAELALADALILIMQGVIDAEAIDTVFSDMENRYRGQKLNAAAAMADYLRMHAIGGPEDATLMRLGSAIDMPPEGSA
jgi:hypothetical protein